MISNTNASELSLSTTRPYKCTIDIAFPNLVDAQRAYDVLSVDEEISGDDKLIRKLSIIAAPSCSSSSSPRGFDGVVDNDDATDTNRKRDNLVVEAHARNTVDKVGAVETSSSSKTSARLRVTFEAKEAKILRVSISSFYDMLNVCLRAFQEFGSSC